MEQYDDGTWTHKIGLGSTLWIPATDFVASAAGPALEVVDAIHHGFLLDGTSSEVVSAAFFAPAGWNLVDVTYYGYNAGAGTGGVALGIYIWDAIDGGSLTSETPTIANPVTFTAGAEDTMQIVTGQTAQAVLAGGYNALKVGRLPANAADTLANDWGLLGVALRRAG